MDFSLSNEQRAWQMTARKFAEEEITPDLARARRDRRPARDLRLGHHQEGLEARLPHAGGAEGMGRPRHRLRDPGAGDGRARARRQRDLEDLQPELEVEPPDRRGLHRRAEGALPASRSSPTTRFLLGKGITEPNAGSDNRLPPEDDPKAGLKLRAERHGDEWILNGEKCFIANAQRRQAVLHRRAHRPQRAAAGRAPPCSWCRATRRASASARCSTRAAGASTRTPR